MQTKTKHTKKTMSIGITLFFVALATLASTKNTALAYSNGIAVPRVIQGGMGIRISKHSLAREVSKQGELGVVSGTAIDTIFVRELQMGDPEGTLRKALAAFPDQGMVDRLLDKYFIEGGKDPNKPYKSIPMWTLTPSQHLIEVCVLANYCEVWLAKHNDDGSPTNGLVGLNLLTKVQLPTIPSLYGAILAEVDYVLMGAGIPMKIPGILDDLAECQDCVQPLDLVDHSDTPFSLKFSPREFWETSGRPDLAVAYARPKFVPIVSSVVLAQSMLKRASGKGSTKGIDGFVVELNQAGGHNAPPRGFRFDPVTKSHIADLNEHGEPVYGEKDGVDLKKFAEATKGLPFWLAGSYADPSKLKYILDIGGAGVQVGTAFALCKESGMESRTKHAILNNLAAKEATVFTDPQASPTGFPFKVLELEGTLSDPQIYQARPRTCNLGYLRDLYARPDGTMGYRCAAGPVDAFVEKGGQVEATVGRKCLCNALCADAGFPQIQSSTNYQEDMLITVGDDVNNCRRYMKQNEQGDWEYSASDVVQFLVSGLPADKNQKQEITNARAIPAH